MIKRSKTADFRGLNNVADPLRLSIGWLTQADNVDITNTNQLARCHGFTRATTNVAVAGAYATNDLKSLYLIDSGELRSMNADMSYSVLRTGLSAAKYYFTEVVGKVFYGNGIDFGLIESGASRPWGVPTPDAPLLRGGSGSLRAGTYQAVCTFVDERGMESGNSDVTPVTVADNSTLIVTNISRLAGYTTNLYVTDTDGTVFFLTVEDVGDSATLDTPLQLRQELPFWNVNGPRGTISALFQGCLYLAETIPGYNQTVIWRSLPMHFHHFDMSGEAVAVPGVVRMLGATDAVLIIGTDRQIWAWDGDKLQLLAEYGVVSGWHATLCDGRLYFWSLRGVCQAMPFANLTTNTVSVPPGDSAGATVIEKDGYRRYLVSVVKGTTPAYNARAAVY